MVAVRGSTDRDEIVELVARLGSWLDGGGGDPAEIYDPEVSVRSPRGETRGLEQVVERVGPRGESDERCQHFHTDALVEVDGDTAVVRANQLVQFYRSAAPPHRTSGLRIEYRLARRADGWRIVDADIALQWIIGDLPT
jgi:hypothetical protein